MKEFKRPYERIEPLMKSSNSWFTEENIEETMTFYRLPRLHHRHLKSTNMLERLNQEMRRRTYVVSIFPNSDACRRLVRALAVETHENWLEALDAHNRLVLVMQAVPVLEAEFGKPVISNPAASYWAMLKQARLQASHPGFCRLIDDLRQRA